MDHLLSASPTFPANSRASCIAIGKDCNQIKDTTVFAALQTGLANSHGNFFVARDAHTTVSWY